MTMRGGNVKLKLIHSKRMSLPTMQRQPAEFKAAREGLPNAFPDIGSKSRTRQPTVVMSSSAGAPAAPTAATASACLRRLARSTFEE
jgi:hypothetical protein